MPADTLIAEVRMPNDGVRADVDKISAEVKSGFDRMAKSVAEFETRVGVAFGKMANASVKSIGTLTQEVNKTRTAVQRMEEPVESLGKRFGTLGGMIRSSLVFLSTGYVMQALGGLVTLPLVIAKASDQVELFRVKLKNLTGDATAPFMAMSAAISRGVNLTQFGDVFAKFALARANIGITSDELIKFTKSVIDLGRVGGMSLADVSGRALQLSQGLASGTLQGDELKAILEGMPIVSQAIADKLRVGIDQMKKMASEGKVGPLTVLNAILEATVKWKDAIAEIPTTQEQITENLKTQLALWSDMMAKTSVGKMFSLGTMTHDLEKFFQEWRILQEGVSTEQDVIYKNVFPEKIIGEMTQKLQNLRENMSSWAGTQFYSDAQRKQVLDLTKRFELLEQQINKVMSVRTPELGEITAWKDKIGELVGQYSRLLEVSGQVSQYGKDLKATAPDMFGGYAQLVTQLNAASAAIKAITDTKEKAVLEAQQDADYVKKETQQQTEATSRANDTILKSFETTSEKILTKHEKNLQDINTKTREASIAIAKEFPDIENQRNPEVRAMYEREIAKRMDTLKNTVREQIEQENLRYQNEQKNLVEGWKAKADKHSAEMQMIKERREAEVELYELSKNFSLNPPTMPAAGTGEGTQQSAEYNIELPEGALEKFEEYREKALAIIERTKQQVHEEALEIERNAYTQQWAAQFGTAPMTEAIKQQSEAIAEQQAQLKVQAYETQALANLEKDIIAKATKAREGINAAMEGYKDNTKTLSEEQKKRLAVSAVEKNIQELSVLADIAKYRGMTDLQKAYEEMIRRQEDAVLQYEAEVKAKEELMALNAKLKASGGVGAMVPEGSEQWQQMFDERVRYYKETGKQMTEEEKAQAEEQAKIQEYAKERFIDWKKEIMSMGEEALSGALFNAFQNKWDGTLKDMIDSWKRALDEMVAKAIAAKLMESLFGIPGTSQQGYLGGYLDTVLGWVGMGNNTPTAAPMGAAGVPAAAAAGTGETWYNSIGNWFGGMWGSLFGTSHAGGIVGDHLTFRRMHSGGIAADEYPYILQRGEGVFTRAQMRALGQGLYGGAGDTQARKDRVTNVVLNINNPINADGFRASRKQIIDETMRQVQSFKRLN